MFRGGEKWRMAFSLFLIVFNVHQLHAQVVTQGNGNSFPGEGPVCSIFSCPEDMLCTDTGTGPVCEPAGELQKVGECRDVNCTGEGRVCRMVVEDCSTPPCLLYPLCMDPLMTCATKFCSDGTICVELKPFGPSCRPIEEPVAPTCADKHCAIGTVCQMVEVQCEGEFCPGKVPTCQDYSETIIGGSCMTVKCSAGFVCQNTPYGPMCNPESENPGHDFCREVECREGYECVVEQVRLSDDEFGVKGICRPIKRTCASLNCPFNSSYCIHTLLGPICQPINNNEGTPPPTSCSTVNCAIGTICILQKVQCIREPCPPLATCIPTPSINPCTFQCIDRACHLTATCNDLSLCPLIAECFVPTEQNVTAICATMKCKDGYECRNGDEGVTCYPLRPKHTPSCQHYSCSEKTECVDTYSGPICKSKTLVTSVMSCTSVFPACGEGKVCRMVEEICTKPPCYVLPICVEAETDCSNCVPGTSCVETKPYGRACRVIEEEPDTTCSKTNCAIGTLCETEVLPLLICDKPPCPMISVPVCNDVVVPIGASCSKNPCPADMACIDSMNGPICKPTSEVEPAWRDCSVVKCKPNFQCVMVAMETPDGRITVFPSCEEMERSCSSIECEPGTYCTLVPDIGPICRPRDISLLPNCSEMNCASGTNCWMKITDCPYSDCPPVPMCIPFPVEDPCETTKCGKGEKCILKDVQCVTSPCLPIPECVGIVYTNSSSTEKTCENIPCSNGCTMTADGPKCNLVPSCKTYVCKDNTECVDSWNGPICKSSTLVESVMNCSSIPGCGEGKVCRMVETTCVGPPCLVLPTCVEAETDCSKCVPGTTCVETKPYGKACRVIEEEPDTTCAKTNCAMGTVCETEKIPQLICDKPPCPMISVPVCTSVLVSIGAACSKNPCPADTSCVDTMHGPICMPITEVEPARRNCSGLPCKSNQQCMMVTVQTPDDRLTLFPSCVEVNRSCSTMVCEPGTYCTLIPDVGPICRPRDNLLLPNCSEMNCASGTNCWMKNTDCPYSDCPPVPMCVTSPKEDPCETTKCPVFQKCILKDVQCVTTPCPPVAECVVIVNTNPNSTKTCADIPCPGGCRMTATGPECIIEPGLPTPRPEGDDKCGTVAMWPTKDKCWKVWKNVTKSTELCAKDFGSLKDFDFSADRFTARECGCDGSSRGDGFHCYGACTKEQRNALTCRDANEECNTDKGGKPFCNCVYGMMRDASGVCRQVGSSCDSCQFNCHQASTCQNVAEGLSLFSCGKCDANLGYEGNGMACVDINECARETYKCDTRAKCLNRIPLEDDGLKYVCQCPDGWTADKEAGTPCRPCVDNNECLETPGICGPNASCENLPGSHRCICDKGYEKSINNLCTDIDECKVPGICGSFAHCNNTPGSYDCICITGFKKNEKGECHPDPEYFCKDCDKATTLCKLAPSRDAYTCECKDFHYRLDARSCAPNTYCDKAEKNNCAPPDRANCTDKPDGSGFNCTCLEGYEGDGRRCIAINICDRRRPCAMISNTMCKADAVNPRDKYECICRDGYVRQLADQGNSNAPCYEENSNVVNNCTLCDVNTEDCKPVVGDKSGKLRACVCKEGYFTAPNGKCEDKNECNSPKDNNCDPQCALCVNKVQHVDGAYFKCELRNGWKGNGTVGTCEDENECLRQPPPCPGQAKVCRNTIGSYKCMCDVGFVPIFNKNDCVDDDECARGNFTCPDYSDCKNTVGSYDCICLKGFREEGRDANGKPKCFDINECDEGINGNKTKVACPSKKTDCVNSKGSYTCVCKDGYRMNILGECVDIDECVEHLDVCDLLSTKCNNTEGSYDCPCKSGYEKIADSNNTCSDIDECTSTVKKHNCNEHSTCSNLPGSYTCSCDTNYEPVYGTHPMRPECKRIDVCKTKLNEINCMCICQNTEEPPFYKCKCQTGSINFNDTTCITPGYCDTEKNPENAEFRCPANSVCKNERCLCERNYEWINVEEPVTVEKIKNRKGCKAISWCGRNSIRCPAKSYCRDLKAGTGECYCGEGWFLDETLNECIDINECTNKTVSCPANSKCNNLQGSYKCECDEGYTNTNTNRDTKLLKPTCETIKYCSLKLDNCTKYENTHCVETNPFYECDCNTGYQRNQTRGQCDKTKGKQCSPLPCTDIDECAMEKHDCDKKAFCINRVGGYDCVCPKGYWGDGKTCIDDNECEENESICNRESENCVNLPGTYNCTCKEGFEYSKNGTCTDIDECLSASLNNCTKEASLVCVNTQGSFYCGCAKGYVKALNGSCIDENECTYKDSCPKGRGDQCDNTQGSYNCSCLKGFRKPPGCNDTRTCPCVDIEECKVGIVVEGKTVKPCGANAQCIETEGSYKCICRPGYEGDAYYPNKCNFIDVCAKFPCDKTTQDCIVVNGAPTCSCKEGYVPAGNGVCVVNPCLTKGVCGASAACFAAPNGTAFCTCPTGFILNAKKECVDANVCKCKSGESWPCRSDLCPDRPLMMCLADGAEPRCVCDKGYKMSEDKKKCLDIDECALSFCPVLANCTNTEGSYICTCPRGQFYDPEPAPTGSCRHDVICKTEEYCRPDPNTVCKQIAKDKSVCVCIEGFKGTGLKGDPLCKEIDPCEEREVKEKKKPCTGANEQAVKRGKECVCDCCVGFRRNATTGLCDDIDECEENLYTCKSGLFCNNTQGSYTCVCPPYHKLVDDKCDKIDLCKPTNNCNATTQDCIWQTGKCVCKKGFTLAPDGVNCTDINECEAAVASYNCPENSYCNNTFGGYTCVCFEGYEDVNGTCKDIDECKRNPCGTVHKCTNLKGSYNCTCAEGYIQNGPRDCLTKMQGGDICKDCHPQATCLKGLTNNLYNCTCVIGFVGDGITDCRDVDECALGLDDCHERAKCTNEQPFYKCNCTRPYEGDGKRICALPDLCLGEENNCPKDSKCVPLTAADKDGNWVTCICNDKGFVFDNVTRQCKDIDECTACTEYPSCPCPREAVCKNTEGAFVCECPTGFKYNQLPNTCDDVDECTEGSFQEKCVAGRGRCNNTRGSWTCTCAAGYINKQGDNQICEKDVFCGIKDECDKKTTKCVDETVGYRCDCLEGLLHVPDSKFKCEDRNECKDGSHNCSLDGTELCTNTYQGFACNCSNGYTKDATTKKCKPDNMCNETQMEAAFCGAYYLCVRLPGKDGKLESRCICETGYYPDEKQKVCVPVPPCKQDFDCPSNSRCQLVQAQNASMTGKTELGTYECICNHGYEKKGNQCFPEKPCTKQPTLCGKGHCAERLMAPFYECQCPTGTKQDNSTAPCFPLTCEGSNVCTPHATCKERANGGGIYCQCKDGYSGLGIMSSPCKLIDLCASATPCSKYASCQSTPPTYNCTCNLGYTGNGTICANVNECLDASLNNCDGNATCVDTQGSYRCNCNPGFTGLGTKGMCKNINECEKPSMNTCDATSTHCKDLEPSYECECKEGYYRFNSTYACVDKNECVLNATICGEKHTCLNLPGSYECICAPGYALVEGSDKKLCADIDECKLSPPVCHPLANCKNTEGSYECTCKEKYQGDGKLNCTIKDICKDGEPTCDTTTTFCKMLPDQPSYQCVCKPGFERITGVFEQCSDIDECKDESTPYDRESVNCINKPGTYELECKPLYTAASISADKKNITCVDKDECAMDPAYAETLKKAEKNENVGPWKTWMVPPKDNSSGYATCYYMAIASIVFDNLRSEIPRSQRLLPFCKNLDPKTVSLQRGYSDKLQGFECDCAPPHKTVLFPLLGFNLYSCPNDECPICLTKYDYECVDKQCRCKEGLTQSVDNGITKCMNRECEPGQDQPEVVWKHPAKGNVNCTNYRWTAFNGYELVRDNVTNKVIDFRDIDECLKKDICCSKAESVKCTGDNCVMCRNEPGSYSCLRTGGQNYCVVDDATCTCMVMPCVSRTSWYYTCDGRAPEAAVKTLDTKTKVCSRIVDASNNYEFMEFDSEKDLFLFAVGKTDCGFLREQPANFSANPIVNYYGPCLPKARYAEIKCPNGVVPKNGTVGGRCPFQAKLEELPIFRSGARVDVTEAGNPNLCVNLYPDGQMLQQGVFALIDPKYLAPMYV